MEFFTEFVRSLLFFPILCVLLIIAIHNQHNMNQSIVLCVGLVQVIGQYCERRDVVRASCRLLVNINHYSGVTNALDKLGILEKLLDCVNIHREARDVVESTALLLKGAL